MNEHRQKSKKLIYVNDLANEHDVHDFRLEGSASITFPEGRMRMQNILDPSLGQKANFVFWCPEEFPSNIELEWDFWPLSDQGLAILFFSATGQHGEDLFDPNLIPRSGKYQMYHHGDINALHVSYYRRWHPTERAFHTSNLRKSYGFHLVSKGADPIPDARDAAPPYHLRLAKYKNEVTFYINNLQIFRWYDDGITYGPLLGGGKIGFRQMAPLIGEYANLKVYSLEDPG